MVENSNNIDNVRENVTNIPESAVDTPVLTLGYEPVTGIESNVMTDEDPSEPIASVIMEVCQDPTNNFDTPSGNEGALRSVPDPFEFDKPGKRIPFCRRCGRVLNKILRVTKSSLAMYDVWTRQPNGYWVVFKEPELEDCGVDREYWACPTHNDRIELLARAPEHVKDPKMVEAGRKAWITRRRNATLKAQKTSDRL